MEKPPNKKHMKTKLNKLPALVEATSDSIQKQPGSTPSRDSSTLTVAQKLLPNLNHMKNEIIIGDKTLAVTKLELTQGYLDQHDVAWESHKRGRNWVATVHFDPSAPNCLARSFWNRGSGSYVAVSPSLAVGEVLEFGADYYTCGGTRHERRKYRRVLAITDREIVLRETTKPGKRPLRPVSLDIQAAEIGGDIQAVEGPLVEVYPGGRGFPATS